MQPQSASAEEDELSREVDRIVRSEGDAPQGQAKGWASKGAPKDTILCSFGSSRNVGGAVDAALARRAAPSLGSTSR